VTVDDISHITVTYGHGGDEVNRVEVTRVYAVNKDISRELGQHIEKPNGEDLRAWLEAKGCPLDSSGGPAYVVCFADGSTVEEYYRDGKRHREDGPAVVWRKADGTMEDTYYRDEKRHREQGPAYVLRSADGSTGEYFYRDGRLDREDGPAIVWRWPDGSTEKEMLPR
jgi:hypothetical protein